MSAVTTGRPPLVQPGGEEAFDVLTVARIHDSGAHRLALDNDERGEFVNSEALDEIGPAGLVHTMHLEGVVVVPTLEGLRQEPVNPSAAARQRRMEQYEDRLGECDRVSCDDNLPVILAGPPRPDRLMCVYPISGSGNAITAAVLGRDDARSDSDA